MKRLNEPAGRAAAAGCAVPQCSRRAARQGQRSHTSAAFDEPIVRSSAFRRRASRHPPAAGPRKRLTPSPARFRFRVPRRAGKRQPVARNRTLLLAAWLGAASAAPAGAGVQIQQNFEYGGWSHCVRLSNGTVELIATTDVGPRVIHFGFVGGPNVFREWPDQLGKTGGTQWRIYGGHRLWHAPENQPRTYAPDNSPVAADWDGGKLTLTEPVEPSTGIQKAMVITLDPQAAHVKVMHRLTNKNVWDVELAPWAISAMPAGGRAIFPQEPKQSHGKTLLPVRTIALWAYTDMQDPRWSWGTQYIQLRCEADRPTPQKGGVRNTLGWAAYAEHSLLFLDRFGFDPHARYPDLGCNVESYTSGDMLELETLGPLTRLPPNGSVTHVENWFLYRVRVADTEASIAEKVLPLVHATDRLRPH